MSAARTYHTPSGTEPSKEEIVTWAAREQAAHRSIAVAQAIYSHVNDETEDKSDDDVQSTRETLSRLCRTLVHWAPDDVDIVTDLIDPSMRNETQVHSPTGSKGVGKADARSLYDAFDTIKETGTLAQKTLAAIGQVVLRYGLEGSIQQDWMLEKLAEALKKPETEEASNIVAGKGWRPIANSQTPTPLFDFFASYLRDASDDTRAQAAVVDHDQEGDFLVVGHTPAERANCHRKRIDLMAASKASTNFSMAERVNIRETVDFSPNGESLLSTRSQPHAYSYSFSSQPPAYSIYDDMGSSRGTTLGTVDVTRV